MLTRLAMSISLPIPIPLSFALRIDGRVLLFTAGVTMLAALVAGLAPALKATRPNLVNELKSDVSATHAGGRRWTLRDGLVVTQIAVTMVLLVAAGLLTRSLMAAQHVDIGFRTGGLAVAVHRDEHARVRRRRARRSSTIARSSGCARFPASSRRRWPSACRSRSTTTATTSSCPIATGPTTRAS